MQNSRMIRILAFSSYMLYVYFTYRLLCHRLIMVIDVIIFVTAIAELQFASLAEGATVTTPSSSMALH